MTGPPASRLGQGLTTPHRGKRLVTHSWALVNTVINEVSGSK